MQERYFLYCREQRVVKLVVPDIWKTLCIVDVKGVCIETQES